MLQELSAVKLLSVLNNAMFLLNRSIILLPSARSDEVTKASVLLYNMGFVYHRDGLERGCSAILRKALHGYEMAGRVLRKSPAGSDLVMFALVNNMGRIRSHFFNKQAAGGCQDDTADKAKLSLSSHFPSVAICMQSGHGDTDADLSPRRPMRSRLNQSARHLGRTQFRLNSTKDDSADEAKLSLSSHFPSVAICMQSGHGDTDADLSPRRSMRSRQYQSARHLGRTQSRLALLNCLAHEASERGLDDNPSSSVWAALNFDLISLRTTLPTR
jgi:hypothetical protein